MKEQRGHVFALVALLITLGASPAIAQETELPSEELAEVCDDGLDNDGNGEADEGCLYLTLDLIENDEQEVLVQISYRNHNDTEWPRMANVVVGFDPRVLDFDSVMPLEEVDEAGKDVLPTVIPRRDGTAALRLTIFGIGVTELEPGRWAEIKFRRLRGDSTTHLSFPEEYRGRALAPLAAAQSMTPERWGGRVRVAPPGNRGLVLWYPLEDAAAADWSGNELHGRLWGGRSIQGVVDDAVELDGIRDRLVFPSIFDEEPTDGDGSYAVSFWFFAHEHEEVRQIVAEHLDTAGVPRLAVALDAVEAGHELVFLRGRASETGWIPDRLPVAHAPIPTREWHHLAYTVGPHDVTVLLDGELVLTFEHEILVFPFCPSFDLEGNAQYGEDIVDDVIFFSRRGVGRSDLFRMSPRGEFVENLTNTDDRDELEPAWSAQSGRIAFIADDDQGRYDLWTMDQAGGQVHRHTLGMTGASQPSWSPNGRRLVFHSRVDGDEEIFVLDLHDGEENLTTVSAEDLGDSDAIDQLTNNGDIDRHPVFLNDEWVLYESSRDRSVQLLVVNVTTKQVFPLLSTREEAETLVDRRPDVVRLGGVTKVVFERLQTALTGETVVRPFVFELAINADGPDVDISTIRSVLPESMAAVGEHYRWSPDGEHLVFISEENGRPEVFRVAADGTGDRRWRLTSGGSADGSPRWGRMYSEPFCHDLGRTVAPFGSFRGGLDEVRVWNYARDSEAMAAEYRAGWELLVFTGATPPAPAARLCPYGLDTECPAYHVCVQETTGAYCESDDDCDVASGESCQPQESGDGECTINICLSQACASRDDCANGYCVEHPVLHERVCNVDCTFDAQCYDFVCASGGPCAVCDSGMCAECRTAADCPDSNAYYCDEGTCVSECYSQERGQSEFICPDFHSCQQGRCELFDIVTQDLLPATLKGATQQPEQLITIEAGATFDYLIPPRMVVEIRTEDGRWQRAGTFRVTKRARGAASPSTPYDATESVETFTTSTAVPFNAVRIRMEPVPYREYNLGSRQTIGFLGDWPYDVGAPPNVLGLTAGRRAIFVRQVRVGTWEFNSQSGSTELAVSVCGEPEAGSTVPTIHPLEQRLVELRELIPLNCTAAGAGIEVTLPAVARPDAVEVEHLFTLLPGAHVDPFSAPQPLTYQAVDVINVRSF